MKFDAQVKQCLLVIALGAFATVLGIYCIKDGDSLLADCGIVLLLCGIPLTIGMVYSLLKYIPQQREAEQKARVEQERKRAAEEKRKEEQARKEAMYKNGEWLISSTDFYNRCCQNGVKAINSSFALQKATAIACVMLDTVGVPKQFHSIFIEEQKLKAFFLEGKKETKKLEDIAKEKQRQEEERKRTTPVAGTPNKQEAEQIRFFASLVGLSGKEKRRMMLKTELDAIKSEIQPLEQQCSLLNEQEKNKYATAAQLRLSAPQQKTHDWAVAGGIAQGIAGPAAGMAAVLDTMNENAKIEARNAQNRKPFDDAANLIVNHDYRGQANAIYEDIKYLEKKAKPLKEALAVLEEKVVLNGVDQNVLSPKLEVTRCNIQKKSSNVLSVTVSLKNNFSADVPKGVIIVADGTLTANVYCDDIFVGSAIAAFPTFGIPCGSAVTMTALCNKYLEGDRNYRAEITFNKLWAMEQ